MVGGIIMLAKKSKCIMRHLQTLTFSHHALGLQFSPSECVQPVKTLDTGQVESHVEQVRMIPQGGKII